MKKIKLLLLSLVSIVTLASCNPENESVWNSLGSITSIIPGNSFTVLDDRGPVVRLSNFPNGLLLEHEGKRVSVFYTRTGDEPAGATEITGEFVSLEFVSTIKVMELTPEEIASPIMQDSLGSKHIKPGMVWFGGNYLNMGFKIGYNETPKFYSVNLVVDAKKSTTTEVFASLYFKPSNFDRDNTSFASYAEGFVNFDFRSSAIIDISEVVTFHIDYIDPMNSAEKKFTIKSNDKDGFKVD